MPKQERKLPYKLPRSAGFITKQNGRQEWMLRNRGHDLCQIAFLPHLLFALLSQCSLPGARPVMIISTSSCAVWLLFEWNKRKTLAGIIGREGDEVRRFISQLPFLRVCLGLVVFSTEGQGSTHLSSLLFPLFLLCRMMAALLLSASVSFSIFCVSFTSTYVSVISL